MRVLIDRYITAEESEKLSAFDDMTLVDLIVNKGVDAIKELPESVKKSQTAVAETIENNVRKLITDEMPTNPKYYLQMSALLAELVKKRKQDDIEYQKYLAEIVALAKKVKDPMAGSVNPEINTPALRALYDNLGEDVGLALTVNEAIMNSREADWRGHFQKEKRIKNAIRVAMPDIEDEELKSLFEIIKNQHDY
jgi:type I restriction enzyme R subunit